MFLRITIDVVLSTVLKIVNTRLGMTDRQIIFTAVFIIAVTIRFVSNTRQGDGFVFSGFIEGSLTLRGIVGAELELAAPPLQGSHADTGFPFYMTSILAGIGCHAL